MMALVLARQEVLRAALDVLAAEHHLADDEASTGRLIEAEHVLDRAAQELAEALDALRRPA
jgi:hypothetical protein